jgi:Ca2+-binding EF-hand superfamily protein
LFNFQTVKYTDFLSFAFLAQTSNAFSKATGAPDDEVLQAFKDFDKDGNGFISASELKQIVSSLGEKHANEKVAKLMLEADTNGDRKISYDEFVKVWSK